MSLSLKTKERVGIKMNDGPYHIDIVDKARINNAEKFARKAHSGQTRKGSGISFIVHPYKVANTVQLFGGSIAQIQAALLHDTVEDAGVTLDEIESTFTKEVRDIVAALSEDKSLPTWQDRKLDYYEKISAPENEAAVLVSLADKMDNLNDTYYEWCVKGEEVFEKFNAPKEKQSWFYRILIRDVYFRVLQYNGSYKGKGLHTIPDLTHIMAQQLSAMEM